MKKAILIISLTFMFRAAFCQENYVPGYLITLNRDTLRGYIDYRNKDKNPDVISFKKELTSPKSRYTPLDIKEFGVKDEIYISGIVETEVTPTATTELKYDKELMIVTDTVFLQVIVGGSKSLLYVMTSAGREQFYIRQDSGFSLLVYKKFLKEQEGQTAVGENKRYVGQLRLYLADCPSIQSKLQRLDYRKSSMEDLFVDYYTCRGQETTFHKKTETAAVRFGIIAGVSITTVKFSGNYIYLTEAGYKPSVNFSGGASLDVILPRKLSKWSIYNELIVSSYEINGQYVIPEYPNKGAVVYTTFGYVYLKLNNMVRFAYPVGKLFLYLNAGISNGYAIYEKNYAREESKFGTEETKALYATRRWELGLVAGLGARLKQFSAEVRYENGNGMSNLLDVKSTANRIYVLLGYRFGRP